MSGPLQCYNISCGQTYHENENNDLACQYHSGKPYFHDGYKEWTCCKMRSRDFSIFMGFKGCTKGRHSNVKPEEPAKPPTVIESECPSVIQNDDDENVKPKETIEPFVPPDPNYEQEIEIFESVNVASAPPVPKTIMICKNCKNEQSTLNLDGSCLYHKGVQIFHDAYKFWSCCQHKKFSDFEDFQKLTPCARADNHILIAKVEHKENWFQTGGMITIALYGLKGARRESRDGQNRSKVSIRGGRYLFARLINHEGLVIFEKEWTLQDYISHEGGKVTINVSNVQIALKKSNESYHWPKLINE
ncbi:cysteine and histidine rich domain containing protein [Dermatophagoides farinae]|uniref:Cysteine and histidine-rich domain-containing protein 1 n=1 Tax=Dermatophagoides farinae TaxID=6954 RepID=A0A922I6Y3_DERFA|nr:cysteine and histidine-rich domain-containing protein RAR1-like [Dermatophagoides farinae]KAH7639505.1 cysteine and histidine-rich domain-containing protein rar1-like [Dermatophagoides farinae]KAH9521835.1 Cysteine and histidine-rich domain-containing protein 1 [Dermatophagoides farinae]